jgi:hypothetical protein
MSASGHSHRKHRKKNPVAEFFDRFKSKEQRHHHHSHHRSEFPGINLPKDYDPEAWHRKDREERISSVNEEPEDINRDFSQSTSGNLDQYLHDDLKPGSLKRKRSLLAAIEYYFQKRNIRREERQELRVKKRIHRQHQQEYRKKDAGQIVRHNLFTITEDEEEAIKKRKTRLFSQRNPIFRNITIAINSLFIFLLTYVLVYLFYWLTSMLVASWYGLDSTLYFYDLKFNDHSNIWNRFNILLVTGIPPFFCLFLGIFLYKVIFKIKRLVGLQKLFILWSSFHLFNHFFGAFPAGVVTDEGFGYVAAWMYMNTAFKFMFSLISLFVLAVIGYYSAQYILETSDSQHRIKQENRLAFILLQIALPWLIGTLVMLMIRIPKNFDYPYETLMLFSSIFLIIPPFFNEKVKPKLNLLRVKKKRFINLGYLAMMLAFLLFLRIMLGIGLHFIIEIHISISPAVT